MYTWVWTCHAVYVQVTWRLAQIWWFFPSSLRVLRIKFGMSGLRLNIFIHWAVSSAFMGTFKNVFILLCVFACMYECTPHVCLMPTEARKRASLELELYVFVNFHGMWILGIEAGYSGRIASAFSHRATSPALFTSKFLTFSECYIAKNKNLPK